MRGQAATEMLTVISIGLLIVIPLFYITLFNSSQSTSQIIASETVNKVASSADYVYALGNESSINLNVRIPPEIVSGLVGSKTILLKLRTNAGTTDIFALTKANVTGTLPTSSGNYLIKLKNINSTINISR